MQPAGKVHLRPATLSSPTQPFLLLSSLTSSIDISYVGRWRESCFMFRDQNENYHISVSSFETRIVFINLGLWERGLIWRHFLRIFFSKFLTFLTRKANSHECFQEWEILLGAAMDLIISFRKSVFLPDWVVLHSPKLCFSKFESAKDCGFVAIALPKRLYHPPLVWGLVTRAFLSQLLLFFCLL